MGGVKLKSAVLRKLGNPGNSAPLLEQLNILFFAACHVGCVVICREFNRTGSSVFSSWDCGKVISLRRRVGVSDVVE